MSGEAIHVPKGLTTEGLLGNRYMAGFIDSVLITLLIFAVLWLAGIPRDLMPRGPADAHFSLFGSVPCS